MQKDKREDNAGKTRPEDDEVVCSNQLLAIMREEMAKNRSGPKKKYPKELKIEEPE